jgi:chemotaxis protein methyltransferase CheR
MLEGRIRRRYHKIGLTSFEDYCRYLFSPDGMENEIDHMIDAVTTNKTDFFREPDHFEYLKRKVLPELIGKQKGPATKIFRFWSAGCATGEEAYTLAMFLSEYRMTYPEFRFSILATDISTRALAKARLGIYEESIITPISLPLRKKYILKSKDPDNRVCASFPNSGSLSNSAASILWTRISAFANQSTLSFAGTSSSISTSQRRKFSSASSTTV